MTTVADPIAPEFFSRLHHAAIEEPDQVRALLSEAQRKRIPLSNGFDGGSNPRTAIIRWLGDKSMGLVADHIRPDRQPQICLSFELGSVRYFLATPPLAQDEGTGVLEVALPDIIYKAERRDLPRLRGAFDSGRSDDVELRSAKGWHCVASITDSSPGGLGVRLKTAPGSTVPSQLELRYLTGDQKGQRAYGAVKHRFRPDEPAGWLRIGLAVTSVKPAKPVVVERRDQILEGSAGTLALHRAALLGAQLRAAPGRVARRLHLVAPRPGRVEVVDYPNDKQQTIKAIINSTGKERGGLAVVIPPSWGRTKETLLPLALTLVSTFESAGEPLTVVRFDGTHRRGESYVEPQYRRPGDEYLGFRFSQAVSDIDSTIAFLQQSERFKPSRVVLVTVSIASVDGRRAVATDSTGLICGWVPLVGIGDLQSCLRTASGGVDYGFGLPAGVKFGKQELTGMVVDVDEAGPDARAHRLFYLNDARQDMASIRVPITWIHGQHDGWIDLERVRDLMSFGDTAQRKLLEVPTGHQLRSSREALEVFQLVSQEVARMGLGRDLRPANPDLAELELQRQAERARRPLAPVDLKEFWEDYLVGRDGRVGIEFMTATNAYHGLMAKQIEGLGLQDGGRVLDLGSGTGDFAIAVARQPDPPRVSITALDYISDALRRGETRFAASRPPIGLTLNSVLADLSVLPGCRIPLGGDQFDAVLASLLISYLREPAALLAEIARVLRPQGRLVLSSLRRDADSSRLYSDGRAELHPARLKDLFSAVPDTEFADLQRQFINDNARIFNLEEEGHFRFWDPQELTDLVMAAGFQVHKTELEFGDPPQVVIVTASRD